MAYHPLFCKRQLTAQEHRQLSLLRHVENGPPSSCRRSNRCSRWASGRRSKGISSSHACQHQRVVLQLAIRLLLVWCRHVARPACREVEKRNTMKVMRSNTYIAVKKCRRRYRYPTRPSVVDHHLNYLTNRRPRQVVYPAVCGPRSSSSFPFSHWIGKSSHRPEPERRATSGIHATSNSLSFDDELRETWSF
jgi:hypothetical protein